MPFLPVTFERTESASDTGKCRRDFELVVREMLDKIRATLDMAAINEATKKCQK